MPTWDADFWPMIKKNRAIEVLKNHHIPNYIPSCASLQLFTGPAILLGGARFAVLRKPEDLSDIACGTDRLPRERLAPALEICGFSRILSLPEYARKQIESRDHHSRFAKL